MLVAGPIALFAQDLSLGLVAHFPFNGNANDESALNIDGLVSGATLVTGLGNETNGAYSFDGVDDFISCGTSNRSVTNIITISYWIKTTSSAPQYIVTKYNWSEDAGYVSLINNGVAGTAGRDGSGTFQFTDYGFTDVTDGNWHHVVSVVNVNDWEIWVDCNLEESITTSTTSPDIQGSEPLVIGKWGYENLYHTEGVIDEVRIYNRVLTPAEMDMLCDPAQILNTTEIPSEIPSFRMYPNPATDQVKVSLQGGEYLNVYNALGELVYSERFNGGQDMEFAVSGWVPGIYTVVVTSQEAIHSEQLVIQ